MSRRQRSSNIANQIVQLRNLPRQQLFELWQKLYGKTAPDGLRRELLIPFLAYKIQENTYGGLKPSTISELHRIARDFEKPGGPTQPRNRPKIKPGTRLIRQWRGESHEVGVAETGFDYRGNIYRSLSEIARKITGTRWSGPAFFKLNRSKAAREQVNG
jgi:Protein of unknown function (DUF2924)